MMLPPTVMVDIGLGSSRQWVSLFLLFILRPQDCLSVRKFGQPLVTQRSWPNYPACFPTRDPLLRLPAGQRPVPALRQGWALGPRHPGSCPVKGLLG